MASIELYSGTEPQVLEYTQGATPAFNAGDLVTCDSTGTIKVAAAAVTFLGIARKDADTVTGEKIPVELININSIYSVKLATTAVGDTCATATDTLIGDGVGIVQYTAGAQMWTDTLADSGYVVGRDPRDSSTGVRGGRVLIRFLSTALANQY